MYIYEISKPCIYYQRRQTLSAAAADVQLVHMRLDMSLYVKRDGLVD